MPDDLSIPPGASEAEVAETIVSARKSWKTVKGKSEAVWPPTLEKALVKALLLYKPTDSRYARALGRFPKRNRFISDYIFEQTGQRRTPKQVGSRLQQLKDVNCGKQLLSHVASWSLGPAPHAHSNMSSMNYNAQQHLSLNTMPGLSSDCSPSPTSPFPQVRTPFGNDHSSLTPLTTSFYSPLSQYNSLPVTPQVRNLDVFLPYDPAALQLQLQQGSGASRIQRGTTLMRFSGCLSRPDSVQAESETSSGSPSPPSSRTSSSANRSQAQAQPAALDREPRVTFSAREPIAASSMVSIWIEGGVADDGSGSNVRNVHGETHSLVCTGTPSLSQYGNSEDEDDGDVQHHRHQQHARNSRSNGRSNQQQSKQPEGFSYTTQLVSPAFWESMRRDTNLSKYTIRQDLIYQLDTQTSRPGETFLTINYRFVPTSTPSPSPVSIAGQIPTVVRSHGSASPASSSSASSPTSASPASVFQMPLQPTSHQQQKYLAQQQQQQYAMAPPTMYPTQVSQYTMNLQHGLPPMMGLAPSSCSSSSSSSSGAGMQQVMSRHGSPHDLTSFGVLPLSGQVLPSPNGSPLSATFPPLHARSGMTPTLGYDDDFTGSAAMTLGSLGVNIADFGFGASPGHGSPLALA